MPGINDDVTPAGHASLTVLCTTLLEAHLLGGSNDDVQRDTVRRLVSELRGEHVGMGW